MKVLGLSCFYHDSAAALVVDGEIVAAAQEERFSRYKHDASFPARSVRYCLNAGKASLGELDAIVFYEKPFLKFERLIETYFNFAPRGLRSFAAALPIWLGEKIFTKKILLEHLEALESVSGLTQKMYFSEHHLSHAASAFFPSPFEQAAILTLDGVGEWSTSTFGIGHGNQLKIIKEMRFPHSLGLLYSAFTLFAGFKVNSGEYKLMGLAPYGEPKYGQTIRDHLIDIKSDGSFRLNMKYFDYCTGLSLLNAEFERLFNGKMRAPGEPLTQFHMDIAASIQVVIDEVVLRLAQSARKESGVPNLCMAGGVALNCVTNGKLLERGIFEKIWIQPAAGDAGGALGAALAYYHQCADGPRQIQAHDGMKGAFLGPEYSDLEIEQELISAGAVFESLGREEILKFTARALAAERVVGWFQGRMEFGPRALGGRSILADARSPRMQSELNLKVKYRESFRPFAPSVLRERAQDWFEMTGDSPYMLFVTQINPGRRLEVSEEDRLLGGLERLNIPRSQIPAVTHVDYSSRVQTVHAGTNSLYYELIKEFEALTACPILVNTSFNVRGEPIVCTPSDAYRCLMGTDIDVLIIGSFVVEKRLQPTDQLKFHRDQFELD